MSRKKRHAEHANHERWLVSYADFITLLFAFFVVMFASSQVDQRKIGKLAKSIESAFTELGMFQGTGSHIPLGESSPGTDSGGGVQQQTSSSLGRLMPTGGRGRTFEGTEREVGILRDELERVLAPEIRRRSVSLVARKGSLVVSLREIGFFDSGSATLRKGSDKTIGRIAGILQARDYRIRFEGHSDNVPIHTRRYASNWELSTARATELIKVFITRHGFAPKRRSAAGYAEYHPVATNENAEGRTLNRRVDLVILAPKDVEVEPLQAPEGPASSTTTTQESTPEPQAGAGPKRKAESGIDVTKPANVGGVAAAMENIRGGLIPKIKAFCSKPAGIKVKAAQAPVVQPAKRITLPRPDAAKGRAQVDVLAIGTSTGGPNALGEVIPMLPADLGVPVVIVQHMPPLFTKLLADRLEMKSPLKVREGTEGGTLQPGEAWLAPGDFHMVLVKKGGSVRIQLNQAPPENSCRPAVDVLFRSVVEVYGSRTLAVVMTGMGQDGLRGCEHIREAGGQVLIQ